MESESIASPRPIHDENRVSILRKAFNVYDADGSGSIDYSEFKRLIQDLGWPAHEEFIDRAVRVLDEDMSGEIEFSEFQKWTEFAYASRVLYRQEMYGLGPRSSSVDGVDTEPVFDEAPDGKKALVIRRTSLTTVFEGREDAEQESQERDSALGTSSGEDEKEDDRRPGLLCCSSGSSIAKDQDRHAEPSSRAFTLRLCNRKSSPHIPFRESNTTSSSTLSRRDGGDVKSGEVENKSLAGKSEGIPLDGENVPSTRNIDAPIREMATMVLSTGRRSRRIHTSRSRAKSVGILQSRKSNQFERGASSIAREKSQDPPELGPRTESKMTVRMRFACGQFEGQEVEESEACSSNSQSFGEDIGLSGLMGGNRERWSEGDDASRAEWPDDLRDGRSEHGRTDEHGRSKRSVEWKDGDADTRIRNTE